MAANQNFLLEQAIDRHPLIISPETPLTEVIELMSQAQAVSCRLTEKDSTANDSLDDLPTTGCALVMTNAQLLGILTERDMVRLVAAGGALDGLTAADVMTRQMVTLKASETQTVFHALNLMSQHRIRHLPIIDAQHQLLGVITPEAIRRTLQPTDLLRLRQVVEVMNTQVVQAPPSASVLQIAQLMTQHQVSCIVIVDTATAPPLRHPEKSATPPPIANTPIQNPKSKIQDPPPCPIGIITERDIIQFQKLELELATLPVQAVMSAPLFPVNPEASLWQAHQQMQQRRVRRLVVTGLQGELQGIVTQTSLLQALDPVEMHRVLELLQHKIQQLELENIQLRQRRIEALEQQVNVEIRVPT